MRVADMATAPDRVMFDINALLAVIDGDTPVLHQLPEAGIECLVPPAMIPKPLPVLGPSGITLLVSGSGYALCGLLPPAAAAGFEACGPPASSCGACGPQASYGSGAAGHQERA
jgi:hypothetical protein